MNYEFIKQLIEQAEAFELDSTTEVPPTMDGFSTWLSRRFPAKKTAGVDKIPDNQANVDTQIVVMLSYLYRYARLYSKKALANTPLTTTDEFSYIVMLLDGPPPTKTKLIERNIHEKTTGTEILRRLINGGLIEQFDDLVDKRSKRIKLTSQGKALMMSLLPSMREVAKVVGGNLTETEKEEFVVLLRKLYLFHDHIFMAEREATVTSLADQLSKAKI